MIIAIDKIFQAAKTQKDFAQFELEICLAGIGCAFLQQRTIVVCKYAQKRLIDWIFCKRVHKIVLFQKSVRKPKIYIVKLRAEAYVTIQKIKSLKHKPKQVHLDQTKYFFSVIGFCFTEFWGSGFPTSFDYLRAWNSSIVIAITLIMMNNEFITTYSRVQKSWNEIFSKILKKSSIA